MEKILTVEDFYEENTSGFLDEKECKKLMIEFAKLHVEAALNNIKKETQLWDDCAIVPYEKIIYSLENIK